MNDPTTTPTAAITVRSAKKHSNKYYKKESLYKFAGYLFIFYFAFPAFRHQVVSSNNSAPPKASNRQYAERNRRRVFVKHTRHSSAKCPSSLFIDEFDDGKKGREQQLFSY
jgi:hypothetical protein